MDAFPLQPPGVVREVVLVAHFDAKRLRSLVDAQPALARAAVDWGFGDWEDALGAASHMGNREIAEYLLSKGARPTIFSAAMLGQLNVVKAFVQAQPRVQRTPGPHSISLLSHARAGGKDAQTVFDYLNALGGFCWVIGDATTYRRTGWIPRWNLRVWIPCRPAHRHYAKGHTTHADTTGQDGTRPDLPGRQYISSAGAEAVRILFGDTGGRTILTVHDPNLILSARRSQP
jgi:hypothetical protein